MEGSAAEAADRVSRELDTTWNNEALNSLGDTYGPPGETNE